MNFNRASRAYKLSGSPTSQTDPIPIMSALPKPLDEVLTEKIHDRTGRRVQNLAVEMTGGTVVLRGRASSFHVKQLAQSGVREVLPQAAVRNGIVVN